MRPPPTKSLEQARKAAAGADAEARKNNWPVAMYRRPTKAFQDVVAGGGAGLRVMMLAKANAVDGGLPIAIDGKIIGAIGVSGVTSDQDGQIAKAGVDGMK